MIATRVRAAKIGLKQSKVGRDPVGGFDVVVATFLTASLLRSLWLKANGCQIVETWCTGLWGARVARRRLNETCSVPFTNRHSM